MRLSNQLTRYRPDFGIGDIIASLPSFATTSVFEGRAAMSIRERDHAVLKTRYARIFEREWAGRAESLERRLGLVSWEAFATIGMEEKKVGADFAASGRGGLRIALSDGTGRPRAFLWMRGSGTEPIFRIMADIEGGSAEDEAFLLEWQTAMLREADKSGAAIA